MKVPGSEEGVTVVKGRSEQTARGRTPRTSATGERCWEEHSRQREDLTQRSLGGRERAREEEPWKARETRAWSVPGGENEAGTERPEWPGWVRALKAGWEFGFRVLCGPIGRM